MYSPVLFNYIILKIRLSYQRVMSSLALISLYFIVFTIGLFFIFDKYIFYDKLKNLKRGVHPYIN